jgi:hypothetical protein
LRCTLHIRFLRPLPLCLHLFLVVLDIVVADERHPDQEDGSQSEREVLRQTESHSLEDKKLAGEVSQSDNVGPVGDGINRTNVEVESRVASNDAGDDCPCTKKSACEGSQLVGGLGVVVSRDQLVRLILRLEVGGLRRKLGVADEAPVVDSSGKV